MAKKIIIHSPKGGQGKTTVSANLAMMLADAGQRVLAVDADETESRGLGLYFNVEAQHGIFELLRGSMELRELVGQIHENLFFLPGGDLVSASRLFDQEMGNPNILLEERLAPAEEDFDFIIFDTSPNSKTRLIFNIFYLGDEIITPIETRRGGVDVLGSFVGLLEPINSRMRKPAGKAPIEISTVIPYWHRRTNANAGCLELLQDSFPDQITDPIGECTALHEAWAQGQMFKEYIGRRSKRPNEEKILDILEDILKQLLTTKS